MKTVYSRLFLASGALLLGLWSMGCYTQVGTVQDEPTYVSEVDEQEYVAEDTVTTEEYEQARGEFYDGNYDYYYPSATIGLDFYHNPWYGRYRSWYYVDPFWSDSILGMVRNRVSVLLRRLVRRLVRRIRSLLRPCLHRTRWNRICQPGWRQIWNDSDIRFDPDNGNRPRERRYSVYPDHRQDRNRWNPDDTADRACVFRPSRNAGSTWRDIGRQRSVAKFEWAQRRCQKRCNTDSPPS